MAAFVAEQVDLLDSLLPLEFALRLFLIAVEDDAKRRMLLLIQPIGDRSSLGDPLKRRISPELLRYRLHIRRPADGKLLRVGPTLPQQDEIHGEVEPQIFGAL